MTRRPGFVFFLSSEWSRYHRPGLIRAVAKATAGRGPVLMVDNPVCPVTSPWHRRERWREWRAGGARMRTVADNLVLLNTAVALHDKLACSVPGVSRLNRHVLSAQVRAAAHELGLAAPLVTWFQFPTFHHYVGALDEKLSVYECYDEHSEVPGLSRYARRRLVGLERKLLQRCDLVFTTSKPLYDAKRAHHANVVLTYNGADCDYFAAVANDSLRNVAERAAQAPTIGYLGTLHEHTDLALLADVAAQRPSWRVVLIGPVQKGVDQVSLTRLRSAPNVELHGWIEEADLIAHLGRFDVGVIPYRSKSRFNHFVNPNKLHEYTAMGKPVVVSPGIDISSNPDVALIAEGPAAFIAAIEAQHSANCIEQVQQRLQTAALNSWQARAQLMLEHVDRTLHAKENATATPLLAKGFPW